MRSQLLTVGLVSVLLGWPSTAPTQQARSPATTLEIIGLRSWSQQMLEEAVSRFQPGISLTDAACAVVLRDSVGFANASVLRLSLGATQWAVLTVLEPSEKHRVRFAEYSVRRPNPERWSELFGILAASPGALSPFQRPEVLVGEADSVWNAPLAEPTLQLRRALRTRTSADDYLLAESTIRSDSNAANRAVAALVLSNFRERDSAYHLLAEALRANDHGASTASMVLAALSDGAARPVDWAPARATLDAILGGTNLFAYGDFLDLLVSTKLDPAIGRELAARHPDLLLGHLGAKNPMTPGPPHRFLVHVSGQDFGTDPSKWKPWLDRPN